MLTERQTIGADRPYGILQTGVRIALGDILAGLGSFARVISLKPIGVFYRVIDIATNNGTGDDTTNNGCRPTAAFTDIVAE